MLNLRDRLRKAYRDSLVPKSITLNKDNISGYVVAKYLRYAAEAGHTGFSVYLEDEVSAEAIQEIVQFLTREELYHDVKSSPSMKTTINIWGWTNG